MPTRRTRVTRSGPLAPDALAWARSPDARRFFAAQSEADYPPDADRVTYLRDAKPWWDDLLGVWLDHRAKLPCTDPDALAFLKSLHEAHRHG